MKKLLFVIIIVLILIAGGYKTGIKYGSDIVINKIANQLLSKDEIEKMMEDPQVQKTIEEQLGTEALQNLTKGQLGTGAQQNQTEGQAGTATTPETVAGNTSQTQTGSQLVFHTKEEAFQFLLTKFSASELKHFADMAEGGVTTEEKNQVKSALMSRLTPEEYQALKVVGLIELQKLKKGTAPLPQ